MQRKMDYIALVTTRTLLNRKFCIDALSYAGTAEAAEVLWKKFEEKKIQKTDDLKRVFLGLASASRPTATHVNITWVSDKLCPLLNFIALKKTSGLHSHELDWGLKDDEPEVSQNILRKL